MTIIENDSQIFLTTQFLTNGNLYNELNLNHNGDIEIKNEIKHLVKLRELQFKI